MYTITIAQTVTLRYNIPIRTSKTDRNIRLGTTHSDTTTHQNERTSSNMAYTVREVIETDREGNKKCNEWKFNSYGNALHHIRQRMMEIIKKDTLRFFRKTDQKVTTEKLSSFCGEELEFWLNENEEDDEQFCYVASYLGWSCFWLIEQ